MSDRTQKTTQVAGWWVACIAVLLTAAPVARAGEPKTLRLWDGDAPGAVGKEQSEKATNDIPTVTVYSPASEKNNGAAVVVCPGGGYGGLAQHEGQPVAEWLNSLGATGVVLRYRLGPKYHHPVMQQDVNRAIRMVRAHAGDWGIDPNRIGVLGFSAGGHLASTAATHWDRGNPDAADPVEKVSARPDVAVLVYPVITMSPPFTHNGSRRNLLGADADPKLVDLMSNEKQVTKETPPTYLVHSSDDKVGRSRTASSSPRRWRRTTSPSACGSSTTAATATGWAAATRNCPPGRRAVPSGLNTGGSSRRRPTKPRRGKPIAKSAETSAAVRHASCIVSSRRS